MGFKQLMSDTIKDAAITIVFMALWPEQWQYWGALFFTNKVIGSRPW